MTSKTSTASTFEPKHFYIIVTMLAASAAVIAARETRLANLLLISAAVFATGLVAYAVHQAVWPLMSSETREARAATVGRNRAALEREKMLVLRSIKELEFDRAMGKMSELDFEEMVARLRVRAIGLMKQLDESPRDWQAQIAQDLERRLASRAGSRAASSGGRPATATIAVAVECAACGTANDADARFCKACGSKINDGSR